VGAWPQGTARRAGRASPGTRGNPRDHVVANLDRHERIARRVAALLPDCDQAAAAATEVSDGLDAPAVAVAPRVRPPRARSRRGVRRVAPAAPVDPLNPPP
jgi:hypothetical protein